MSVRVDSWQETIANMNRPRLLVVGYDKRVLGGSAAPRVGLRSTAKDTPRSVYVAVREQWLLQSHVLTEIQLLGAVVSIATFTTWFVFGHRNCHYHLAAEASIEHLDFVRRYLA